MQSMLALQNNMDETFCCVCLGSIAVHRAMKPCRQCQCCRIAEPGNVMALLHGNMQPQGLRMEKHAQSNTFEILKQWQQA